MLLARGDVPDDRIELAQGTVDVIKGGVALLLGDLTEAVERSARAVEELSLGGDRNLAYAVVLHIASLQAAGELRAALEVVDTARHDRRFRTSGWHPWTNGLLYVDWFELDLSELERHALVSRNEPDPGGALSTKSGASYYSGVARYLRNDIEAAAGHFTEVLDTGYRTRADLLVHAAVGSALCALRTGQRDEARRIADRAATYANEFEIADLIAACDALHTEIALDRGEIGRALRWAERFDSGPPIRRLLYFSPTTTLVKVLLADGSPASLERADKVMTTWIVFAEATHWGPLLVQLLGLRAMRAATCGDDATAREDMARAVSLSQPGEGVRLLADLGPRVAGILNQLDVHGEELAHVAAILAAIDPARCDAADPLPAVEEDSALDRLTGLGLTHRESEILRLLAERYSNKEIARALLIAPSTVKKHTIHLYEKLHVSGRREAVEKATALGYLEPG